MSSTPVPISAAIAAKKWVSPLTGSRNFLIIHCPCFVGMVWSADNHEHHARADFNRAELGRQARLLKRGPHACRNDLRWQARRLVGNAEQPGGQPVQRLATDDPRRRHDDEPSLRRE